MPDQGNNSSRGKQTLVIGAIVGALGLLLAGGVVLLVNLGGDGKPAAKDPAVADGTPPESPMPIDEPGPATKTELANIPAADKKDTGWPPLDQAEFMGTRARGKRFCIIADASNSMRGSPLTQLKKEIVKTLDGLRSSSQFYVIFFNATDIPMPYPSWLSAEKENISKVKPWVEKMTTVVKTLPASAFERAFKLQPKPDVIFFMTDGLIPKAVPTQVANLNQTAPRVTIHTIMFSKARADVGAKGANAEHQLRLIADQSDGTYRHVKND